ncbi:MAG TPA: FliM/FliN family flagellar motor C-terminal domain-containing protein [Terracidiphilus sp.]|nr:FliM/FliN family flagellar motor C-terminal domain-containing protein [Terracidiphilus sp.]
MTNPATNGAQRAIPDLAATKAGAANDGNALVPVAVASLPERSELGPHLAGLPVPLDVGVPLRDFRVRNLLALNLGTVVETQWQDGDDLPLSSGRMQLAWSEFEVVDSRLAVRITRLR